MNADYLSSLKTDSKPRYRHKLDLVGLKDCPYRLPADIWCDNPVQWPEIEYSDIYDYLINTPSKPERAAQILAFLFDFLDFLFLKRLIEEPQIITKKLMVEFYQMFLIALKAD